MNNAFKQTTEYNCGAAALCFLLSITGNVASDVDTMTRELGSTDEAGTTHQAIEDWLYENEYVYKASRHHFLSRVSLPMLVNYWKEDDGHYGVLTDLSFGKRNAELWDPADGCFHLVKWDDFLANWFSKRYGKRWGLYNLRRRVKVAGRTANGEGA
jgi:predicted double-glycine peptidase